MGQQVALVYIPPPNVQYYNSTRGLTQGEQGMLMAPSHIVTNSMAILVTVVILMIVFGNRHD